MSISTRNATERSISNGLYVFSASRRSTFIFRPQMRDLDAVFDELPAYAKMPRDLIGATARLHQTTQRRVRNQRRGPDGISSLFVIMIVIARQRLRLSRFIRSVAPVRVFADNGQAIRFMT